MRVLRWLIGDLRHMAIALLLLATASGWITNWSIDKDRDRWRAAASAEQAAHQGTVLNYRIAAMQAQMLALANQASVEARWRGQYQEAIHEKTLLEHDYRTRLADWLRQQPTSTSDTGSADGNDLPTPAAMPAGVVQPAGTANVSISDLDRCAIAFAQLAALIGFVESASTVDTISMPVVNADPR